MFTIARPESFFSFLNVTCQRDMSRVVSPWVANTFHGRKLNFSRCSCVLFTHFWSETQLFAVFWSHFTLFGKPGSFPLPKGPQGSGGGCVAPPPPAGWGT